MKIKFTKLDNNAVAPLKMTVGSSGYDLTCTKEVNISPNEIVKISTGLAMEIPFGWEGQIRPRSSIYKLGLDIPDSPGTIDSDYRGDIGVIIRNIGDSNQLLLPGTRIAQIVISAVEQVDWIEVIFGELSSTSRGTHGFGSTGALCDGEIIPTLDLFTAPWRAKPKCVEGNCDKKLCYCKDTLLVEKENSICFHCKETCTQTAMDNVSSAKDCLAFCPGVKDTFEDGCDTIVEKLNTQYHSCVCEDSDSIPTQVFVQLDHFAKNALDVKPSGYSVDRIKKGEIIFTDQKIGYVVTDVEFIGSVLDKGMLAVVSCRSVKGDVHLVAKHGILIDDWQTATTAVSLLSLQTQVANAVHAKMPEKGTMKCLQMKDQI